MKNINDLTDTKSTKILWSICFHKCENLSKWFIRKQLIKTDTRRNNLNIPVYTKDIKVIKYFHKEIQDQDNFTGEFFQTLKEKNNINSIQILLQYRQRWYIKEGTFII